MANVGFYEPLAEFRKRDNFDVVFRAALDDIAGTDPYTLPVNSELSIGWVGSRFFSFFVSWVGSTTAKVLKNWRDYFNAFKARIR